MLPCRIDVEGRTPRPGQQLLCDRSRPSFIATWSVMLLRAWPEDDYTKNKKKHGSSARKTWSARDNADVCSLRSCPYCGLRTPIPDVTGGGAPSRTAFSGHRHVRAGTRSQSPRTWQRPSGGTYKASLLHEVTFQKNCPRWPDGICQGRGDLRERSFRTEPVTDIRGRAVACQCGVLPKTQPPRWRALLFASTDCSPAKQ